MSQCQGFSKHIHWYFQRLIDSLQGGKCTIPSSNPYSKPYLLHLSHHDIHSQSPFLWILGLPSQSLGLIIHIWLSPSWLVTNPLSFWYKLLLLLTTLLTWQASKLKRSTFILTSCWLIDKPQLVIDAILHMWYILWDA